MFQRNASLIFILFVGLQTKVIKCGEHDLGVRQTSIQIVATKLEASCLGFGALAYSSVEWRSYQTLALGAED